MVGLISIKLASNHLSISFIKHIDFCLYYPSSEKFIFAVDGDRQRLTNGLCKMFNPKWKTYLIPSSKAKVSMQKMGQKDYKS